MDSRIIWIFTVAIMRTSLNLRFLQGTAPFQYWATYSATLSVVTSGMHYGWPSPSLPKLIHESSSISVSDDEGSWLAVLPLLGSMLGSPIAALIVDKLGRKRTILLSSLPYFAAWLMVAFAGSVLPLNAGRFIAGLSDGLVLSTVPMYIGEIADPKVRGLLGSGVPVAWIFGILLINVIGSYLTITTTAMVSSLLPVLSLLTFIWMPESPYYLVMRGNRVDATKHLQKLRGVQDVEGELNRITKAIETQIPNAGRCLDLFTVKSNRKALYVIAVLRVVQQLSGTTAIIFYTQYIVSESGTGISPEVVTIIYFSVQLLLTIISSSIVDIAGRRPLLIASSIGTVITLTTEAIYFYLKSSTDLDLSSLSLLPVIALISFVIIFSLGLQTIPLLMLGELFPANVKAVALCLAQIFFALLGAIVSKFFQITKDTFGMYVPFFAFAVGSILGLGAILIFVPETKSKTLEEIQMILRGGSQESEEEIENTGINGIVKE